MCDNIGELGIFIAGCTVVIVMATVASVIQLVVIECIPGLVQTGRFVSLVTMIVNSLYFLSCILFCMIQ